MSRMQIQHLQRGMHWRETAIALLCSVPLMLALIWGGLRASLPGVGVAAALLLCLVSLILLLRRRRAISLRHVAWRLDDSVEQFEDSTELLLRDRAGLGVLQQLQQQRIEDRLRQSSLPDLRTPWPWWRIGSACVLALLIVLLSGLDWNGSAHNEPSGDLATNTAPATAEPVRLLSSWVQITAPGYAALPVREETSLDVKALQGSQLRWSLRFDPQPRTVQIQFIDGDMQAMSRNGDAWNAELKLKESVLYRIVTDPAMPVDSDRLYRIDALPDEAPKIQVATPDRSLSLHEQGQSRWPLDWSVEDDFGVERVELQITLVQGSGEQVAVNEHRLRMRAEPNASARHGSYRHSIDLSQLGMAAGDDLIVQIQARDNREPQANSARSASFILRWPNELDFESTGIDGLVQKVMPAYFRSQRQIIIDTEALVAQRGQLATDAFLERSDIIGVDQKILRLRYGQFLGEEFESGERSAQSDHADGDRGHKEAPTQQDALSGDHDHVDSSARFGNEGDVVAQFGHTHDHAEAATLLDPETKKLLRSALSEMWQAELKLRMGEPENALPYENRALEFIKQVQQASRIYLARVGLELPPVDESRRLSGDRGDVRNRPGALVTADREREPITALYRELQAGGAMGLESFEQWLRTNPAKLGDVLGLRAELDALRRQPECVECRTRLLDALWKELPTPPTTTTLRTQPDVQGRHYLDQLSRGQSQ